MVGDMFNDGMKLTVNNMLDHQIGESASILVMACVVAVNRKRQAFQVSVMHATGTCMSDVIKSVLYEDDLSGTVLSLFATVVGSVIAALIVTC